MKDEHNQEPLCTITDAYKRAYALFEKTNTLKINGVPIVRAFEWDGVNLWHHFSQRIFNELLKKNIPQDRVRMPVLECGIKFLLALLSCIALVNARIKKVQVLIYSVDIAVGERAVDPRIVPVYEALSATGVTSIEYFHTLISRKPFYNLWRRKRLAVYHEGIDCLLSFVGNMYTASVDIKDISWDGWHKNDRVLVEPLLMRYLLEVRREAKRIIFMQRILRFLGVRMIVAIDDPRYYGALLHAGRKEKIWSVAVQHGHFTKYHVGWRKLSGAVIHAASPDQYLVWSEYWKNELARLNSHYSAETIKVGGVKNLVQQNGTILKPVTNELGILIPYETVAPHKEVRAYMDAMGSCRNIHIFFKLRPDIAHKDQLVPYGLEEYVPPHITIVADISTDTPIALAAGVYSTMLYDVLQNKIRAIILDTSMDYGEGMVVNGVADRLSFNEHLCESLCLLSRNATQVAAARAAIVNGTNPSYLKDSLVHVINAHLSDKISA